MLDLTTLENALRFLGRAQLVGDEVPAFVQVTNALHDERLVLQSQAAAAAAARAEHPGD